MSDCCDEIVVVPGAFSYAVAYGNFIAVCQLEDVSYDAVDERDVGGSVVLSGSTLIFPEMHIE
ncbi:hypothetical protein, partial [Martelella sp. FOR1707]